MTSRGQYVLTGLQQQHGKHLLLVDPHGVVRTKDRRFDSVSHLIGYHRDNQLPIISAGERAVSETAGGAPDVTVSLARRAAQSHVTSSHT
ncbi:unnamed protein product [Lampetra fluviatilis]